MTITSYKFLTTKVWLLNYFPDILVRLPAPWSRVQSWSKLPFRNIRKSFCFKILITSENHLKNHHDGLKIYGLITYLTYLSILTYRPYSLADIYYKQKPNAHRIASQKKPQKHCIHLAVVFQREGARQLQEKRIKPPWRARGLREHLPGGLRYNALIFGDFYS